jgi:hypothetical protein
MKGYLYKNKYKNKDNHPDLTGFVIINDEKIKIAGWYQAKDDLLVSFQADTYILNVHPYTIDYFINLNKKL